MDNSKNNKIKLMCLSIPKGWAIADNKFYDCDPVTDNNDKSIVNWQDGFIEDVLWIFEIDLVTLCRPENNFFDIYLGWFPDSSADGCYKLELLWLDDNGESHVIENIQSKERFIIRDKLEEWLYYYNKWWFKDKFKLKK